ncbi:MAG: hypothetical protein PHQ75_06760 [Thermoguttaceae bacterium]|nr:hypothetical protein [Thermoguttaceae bacterium]
MVDKPNQEDFKDPFRRDDEDNMTDNNTSGAVTPPDTADTPDVYAVATPEKTFRPETGLAKHASHKQVEGNVEVSDEKNPGRDTGNDDFLDDENELLSLDDLYERKRQERLGQAKKGETGDPLPKRRMLPLHPFITGIATPFFSSVFALRFLLMVAAGFLPLYLATLFFSNMLKDKYLEEGYKLAHFLGGIWDDKNILFLFCFLWGVFCVPYSLYVFAVTAEGDDKMEEWPEFNFIGGFGQFLWLVLLILMGGTPGYFVGLVSGCPTAGFILSTLFFTPVLFLSCMETDTLFTLITPSIARSLFVLWKGWLLFYCASAVLFLATVASGVFTLWAIQKFECSRLIVLVATVIVASLFSLAPIIYLRFLGRLGWMIAQERRLNPALEVTDEENKKSQWEKIAETFRKFY